MKLGSNKPEVEVPEVPGIDLDYLPDDYFAARDLGAALPSDIKGQVRRELARQAAAEGRELPAELLAAELSDEARRQWGAIHPALMGGEYLPSLDEEEVEIARITLASVLGDTISVRARREGRDIRFSIEDEYGTEYIVRPASDWKPLRMRQLIAMIDGADGELGAVITPAASQLEYGTSPEEARDFVRIESDFYPQLSAYYDARLERWFAEYEAQIAAGEDEENPQ
jgi:hypothetical protein